MIIDKITPQIAGLYIGQKCLANSGRSFTLESVDSKTVCARDWLRCDYETFKLVLRRIESLTGDERAELIENAGSGNGDFYTPTEILWLTSKGFDIFGLIDAGLAVDADTLK